MKQLFFIITFLFCVFSSIAQNVTNVDFYQEDDKIVITYDLDKLSDIYLSVSTNGGITFSDRIVEHVTGDIGAKVASGHNKIVWDVLKNQNELSGNIVFKVQAVQTFFQGFEGVEWIIPLGTTTYFGKKRVGGYFRANLLTVGFNFIDDVSLGASLTAGPRFSFTEDFSWYLGAGFGFDYKELYLDINHLFLPFETGFVFKKNKVLFSVGLQDQYMFMVNKHYFTPMLGIGVGF